jgi:REP element-mobilizing transposase RayT
MPTPQDQDKVNLMKESKLKITQRNLPHWELDGSVYFITFNTWEKLELTPEARQVVLSACKFFNNQRYQIFALVVMPDHVHMLIQPLLKSNNECWSLSSIMHSIKSYSAKQVPKVMKHIGTVWQSERYDRINRNDQEFWDTWEYIRQNPVNAGLSNTPEEYTFFWQESELNRFF